MATWVQVASEEDCEQGTKICKSAGTKQLVICNVEGELHAFADMCPHAGLPLGQGPLNGKSITCPFHGYTYCVKTGKNVDFESDIPLRTFPVRVEEGKIEVELPD